MKKYICFILTACFVILCPTLQAAFAKELDIKKQFYRNYDASGITNIEFKNIPKNLSVIRANTDKITITVNALARYQDIIDEYTLKAEREGNLLLVIDTLPVRGNETDWWYSAEVKVPENTVVQHN